MKILMSLLKMQNIKDFLKGILIEIIEDYMYYQHLFL